MDGYDAGVQGFTFHIDSSQGRPGWKGASELDLCELRLKYAKMVAAAGDVSVTFNNTGFPHTLEHVPALMSWAAEHIDLVHSMVFILFRTFQSSKFDYYAQGKRVEMDSLAYYDEDKNPEILTAPRVIETIRKSDPDFTPCAYLGGTKDPNSMKWTLSGRIGTKGHIHGYVGPKYLELVQTAHHAATGRWLGYVPPSLLKHGRSMMLGLSPFDSGVRSAARSALSRPWRLANRSHFQSILIIQPIDMMPDGESNMCDGCPDMTVHNGELVWSCRLDELTKHGCFLAAAPKGPVVAEAK